MDNQDRLLRALSAPVSPAKDMHFTLEVMRRAEAERFQAEMARKTLRAAGIAALGALALLPLAGWAAENADMALDAALAVAGLAAVAAAFRSIRRRAAVRR